MTVPLETIRIMDTVEKLLVVLCLLIFLVTTFGETTTSFMSTLQLILTTRIPPYAALGPDESCRLVLMVKADDTIQRLVPVPAKLLLTVEILQDQQLISKSRQRFKFSPLCVHAIVDLTMAAEIPSDKNWVNGHVTNVKPVATHFLVVGSKPELLSFIGTDAYDLLKYKTALTLDTAEVIVGDSRVYKATGDITPLPSESELIVGRKITLMMWKLEPYTLYDKKGELVGGFNYRQGKEFCTYYNASCSYRIEFVGIRLPNGTWIGFVRDLLEGKGDILFGLGLIQPRYGTVDFTSSGIDFECKFITSHPRSGVKWQALVYPFDPTVWLVALLFFLGMIPLYVCHFQFSCAHKPMRWSEALYESVATPFCLLLQECVPIPRQAKLLTVFFIVYSLLIGNYYNSNLISFLTFPEKDFMPTTMKELAASRHKFEIGLTNNPGSIMNAHFLETSNPEALQIREVLEMKSDWGDCVRRAVVDYKYVCIALTFSIDMYAAKNFTLTSNFRPFVASKDVIFSIPLALATTWNSRYYTIFNRNTLRLADTGHITRWNEESLAYVYARDRSWIRNQLVEKTELAQTLTQVMKSADTSTLKPFTLSNFSLCFGSLVGGLTIGFVIWMLEMSVRITNVITKRFFSTRVSEVEAVDLES